MDFAKLSFIVVVLLLLPSQNESAGSTRNRVPVKYTNFIKSQCNRTEYRYVCLKTLLPYASSVKANSTKMCTKALEVAIHGTRNATLEVMKLRKHGITRSESLVLRGCISDLKDAVYELKVTIDVMGRLGDKDWEYEWDTAKTYASAVITDADTCINEFSGRKVDATIRRKVKHVIYYVQQLTSNALSLINVLY